MRGLPFVLSISEEKRVIARSDFPHCIFSGVEVVKFEQSTGSISVFKRALESDKATNIVL